MKKLILFLSIFVSTYVVGQRDTTVDKGIYKVIYSQKYKNPLRVVYKVDKPKHGCDRAGMNFYGEEGIVTATNKDYKANNYDKGHMAAAETFADSCGSLYLTFSYLNCAVQHFKLNRGIWKILEMKEREWAQQELIFVKIDVIFDKKAKQLPSGAFIPSSFKKTILFTKSKKTLIYVFPNQECTNNLEDYLKNK